MDRMATATLEQPQVFGVRLASGVARAEALSTGEVVVRDVPLFAEIRPTDPGVREGIRQTRDRAWLERAVAKTRERIAGGKRPIMTLRHYFDAPDRVGVYEPTRIDVVEVNPGEEPRATVFGDKVYESRSAFEKAKNYDFRSIEISPDSPEEFSALALLRDKEPYHKFPNLREQLAQSGPAVAEAFQAECFRALAGSSGQVWRGRPEAFEAYAGANNPYAVANSMLNKGQITKAQFDDVVAAIKRDSHSEKEAAVAETKAPEKEHDYKAKFEAMMHKTFESMLAKVHEAVTKELGGEPEKKEDHEAEKPEAEGKKTEAEKDVEKGEKKEEKEKKEAAAHAAAGPNAGLPPAVSQARPGELGGVPEAFAARVATQEQTILGLRSIVEKMQREKEAVAIVASARKALLDMGAPSVSEAFEAAAFKAAVDGGQKSVDALLESVKLGMGLSARGPETFGAFGASPAVAQDDDLKKAVETFGARPDKKTLITNLHRDYMSAPESVRRSIRFFDYCRGRPDVNDGALEGRIVRG